MAGPLSQLDVTRLILRHRAGLHAYVYACLRDRADAEEVFQEVSLAIVESHEQLRDEAGFLPWAREIAVRRVRAHVKQSGRRERPVDPTMITALAEANESLEARQPAEAQLAALHACLDKLSPAHRELVRDRYDTSFRSIADLAKKCDRSVRSVNSLLTRIRASLRECIERRLGSETAR